jgi:DNA polymerase III epsilon subunit-like protein
VGDQARADLYISADIETDGPIPGPFSMLSFALVVAGSFDGHEFRRCDPRQRTFYRELAPISENFEHEALDVNGLDRDRLATEGLHPREAMSEASDWVLEAADQYRAVLVAYPVAFDWAFLYWYFIRFTGSSPFGYSSCLDIRTLYQARAHTVHDLSSKRHMPANLRASSLHTHNALDDAVEQAELFTNVFTWAVASELAL